MYAVLFDIDGTLLQTGGAGHVAFGQTFAEVFQVTEFSADISFAGRSDRAIALEIMKSSGIEPSDANWQKFYDHYCQRLGPVLEELDGRVLPGVESLLDTLAQDEQTVVGLLTGNTAFGAKAKTSAYGIGDRFAFGGFGDRQTDRNMIAVEARQAATDYLASEDLGALCGTMVIGDTPADVRCGREIDAFVVAVATGSSSVDDLAACNPDLVLEDLTDTEALLLEVSALGQR